MSFPAIAIPHAADVAEDHLDRLIFSGTLRPGMALPSERRLAEEMGVSRTTLREALSRMQGKGLLRREGTRARLNGVLDAMLVASPTGLAALAPADLQAMLIHLIASVAERATIKLTPPDRTAIREAAVASMATLNDGTLEDAVQALHELFLLVAEASHNFLAVQTLHVFLAGFVDVHIAAVEAIRRDSAAMKLIRLALAPLIEGTPQGAPRLLSALSLPRTDAVPVLTDRGQGNAGPQQVAAERIAAALVEGSYLVGDVLPPIPDLARAYGLSENAVRLGLQILMSRGVVESERSDRVRVTATRATDPITFLAGAITRQPVAVTAVFEFRIMLERWSARLAADQATVEQRERLETIIREMAPHVDTDPDAYGARDVELHGAIADAAGNAALAAVLNALWRLIKTVTRYWLHEHLAFRGSNAIIHTQHETLADAIIARDGARAEAAMDAHLTYVTTTLRDINDRRDRAAVTTTRLRMRAS